jgi:hypothetical protein
MKIKRENGFWILSHLTLEQKNLALKHFKNLDRIEAFKEIAGFIEILKTKKFLSENKN